MLVYNLGKNTIQELRENTITDNFVTATGYQQWLVVPWVLPELQSVSVVCPEAGRPPWQSRQPSRHTQSELQLFDCHTLLTCGSLQSETQNWQTAKHKHTKENLMKKRRCGMKIVLTSLQFVAVYIIQFLPGQLRSRWRGAVLGCGLSRKQRSPPLNECSEKLEIIPSTSLPASVKTLAQSAAEGWEKNWSTYSTLTLTEVF